MVNLNELFIPLDSMKVPHTYYKSRGERNKNEISLIHFLLFRLFFFSLFANKEQVKRVFKWRIILRQSLEGSLNRVFINYFFFLLHTRTKQKKSYIKEYWYLAIKIPLLPSFLTKAKTVETNLQKENSRNFQSTGVLKDTKKLPTPRQKERTKKWQNAAWSKL